MMDFGLTKKIATKEEFETYANELIDLIKEKKVEVRIHKEYTLADAQQAHKVGFCHPNTKLIMLMVLNKGHRR